MTYRSHIQKQYYGIDRVKEVGLLHVFVNRLRIIRHLSISITAVLPHLLQLLLLHWLQRCARPADTSYLHLR